MGMERCYKGPVSYSICLLHKTGATQKMVKGEGRQDKPKDQWRNINLVYWINFFDKFLIYQMRKYYLHPKRTNT